MDQDQRLRLHNILLELMPDGQKNVYFQPPDNIRMEYPCLVYKRVDSDVKYASNLPYSRTLRYELTAIDSNPDSGIPEKIAALPLSSHTRFFVANGLNHDIFNLYF